MGRRHFRGIDMLGTLAGRGGENAEFSFSASPNVGRPEPPAIWIKSSIPVLNAAILILSVHFPLRPPQFSCLKAGHGHGPRRPAEVLQPALFGPPADA